MLEMLKERKAALEAQGKKGFTLMEMLIVIAIIAILIAIAIPLFTQQLNAAEDAADQANARALYAAMQADYMLNKTGFTAPEASTSVVYEGTTYKFRVAPKISGGSDTAPGISVTLHDDKKEHVWGTVASS